MTFDRNDYTLPLECLLKTRRIELLQGTLDLLILRTLLLGPAHGHAIAKAIELNSDEVLQVEQGSLYPALHRLIKRGWIAAEDGTSENNRRAKFYRLRRKAASSSTVETSKWDKLAGAIARILRPAKQENKPAPGRDRKRLLAELESDLQNHIERETQDNIARGMSPEDARFAAMRKFGNVTRVKEDTREVWTAAWLDQLLQDFRFAFRMLRKSPVFAPVAVLTLALGIGANTAIFTIIDSVMLRAIPVSNPQQLVVFSWKARKEPDIQGHSSFGDCDDRPGRAARMDCSLSVPYFEAVRAYTSDSFSQVAAFAGPISVDFAGNGKAAMAQGTYVSGDFFSMLGVPMALGRPIGPDDNVQSAASVIVLDYSYWRTAFASDPNVVGRRVRLNDTAATIVGVAGKSFTNLTPGKSHDFYMPLSMVLRVRSEWWKNGDRLFDPASFWVVILGRLQPGISITQAQAAADSIFRNETIHGAKPLFTSADDPTIELHSIKRGLQGENVYYTPMLYTMMVAVGIVLLIACTNVAGLMLARWLTAKKRWRCVSLSAPGAAESFDNCSPRVSFCPLSAESWGVLLAVWGVKAIVQFLGGTSDRWIPVCDRTERTRSCVQYHYNLCDWHSLWSRAGPSLFPRRCKPSAQGESVVRCEAIYYSLAPSGRHARRCSGCIVARRSRRSGLTRSQFAKPTRH